MCTLSTHCDQATLTYISRSINCVIPYLSVFLSNFKKHLKMHLMVEWLFLAVTWGCLRFVIVVFPDHTYLLFLPQNYVAFV